MATIKCIPSGGVKRNGSKDGGWWVELEYSFNVFLSGRIVPVSLTLK